MPSTEAPVNPKRGAQPRLFRAMFGSLGVRVAASLLTLAAAIVLARMLGPAGYGVYSYAYVIVLVLAIPAQLGLPTLVVREIAKLHAHQDWGMMRGLLQRTNQIVLLWSLGLTGIGFTVLYIWFRASSDFVTLMWAFALLPLMALGALRGAALRGLHKVALGQLPEQALRPALLIVGLFIATLAGRNGTITPGLAMGIHVAAGAAAYLIGAALLLMNLPAPVRKAVPEYDTRRWTDSIVPLSLLLGLQIIFSQMDTLILGMYRTDAEVGVYRAAVQTITVVTFANMTVSAVLAPNLAALHAKGDMAGLQRLVRWSSRMVLLMTLTPAVFLMLFNEHVLARAFGASFAPGGAALFILCIGQIAAASVGPVGLLMNMTGHERRAMPVVIAAVLMNASLNLLLVPRFGIRGAAVANAVSYAFWNLMLAWQVRQRLGIISLPITFGRRDTP
jgi:O-antigen/teichoic acid export membrane protein